MSDSRVRIALENPRQGDVVALIDALDAYQQPLYPPESHHGIDLHALSAPSVLFAVARLDGIAVACGAVALGSGYGEIKRAFVQPSQRGRGIGKALLERLEAEARARGCTRFSLETGYLQTDALRLYENSGYARCAPFGGYVEDPNSVFMTKTVPPAPHADRREVSVWRATLADLAGIAPLFDAYRQFYGRSPDAVLAADFLRERLERRESVILLARDANGAQCGFAQLYPNFSSVRAARGYLLNDLFVAMQARRKGAGRALLESAAQFARAEGVARLKLFTAVSNSPAQRLYESLGWVRDTDFYEYNLNV